MVIGKKDTITKEYMSEPRHFADAFNFYLFAGRQVICPEKLSVLDPTEIAILIDDNKKEVVQKIRDVLKECILMEDERMTFLLLEIENHSEVHYAVSVKNMIYDALNYGKQVSQIEKKHRADKDYEDSGEFLSGFKKTDKLNLIVPKEIKDFEKFATDFGKVMKFISVSKDEKEYEKMKDDKMFESVEREAVQVINECTGANIQIPEGEEKVNMCEAARKLREKDIAFGIQQGVQQGLQQGVELTKKIFRLHSNGKNTEFIAKECNISVSEVEKILE